MLAQVRPQQFRRIVAFVCRPGSRALDILEVLVARAGDIVAKDEISAAVWPGRVVEDSNLTVHVSVLRRVLDQGRSAGTCIQTVPGRGYHFVAPVTRVEVRDGTVGPRQSGASSAPRLSIVVLPFANLSNDPEQQYFTDGITNDLTTDLSRLAGMFVISRNTAFTYRNKLIGTKQIGRELGVRYVLEGSIRRSDNQLRVNTQLIDAATDAHLWAERFDRDMGDLFAKVEWRMISDYRDFTIGSMFRGEGSITNAERAVERKLARL